MRHLLAHLCFSTSVNRLQTNLLVAPCPTYSEHIIRDYRCAHLVVCASLSGVQGIYRRSLSTFHSQILSVTILVFCVNRFSFLGNLWLPPAARGWLEQICANDFFILWFVALRQQLYCTKVLNQYSNVQP